MTTAGNFRDLTHIGARLSARRAELDLSISDIADITNIRPDFLIAIEALSPSDLPSIGYVLGFVRSYAKAVGMDDADAVAAYKVDVETPKNLGMRDRPHFVPVRKIRLPRGFVPALTALGFAVMIGAWYGLQTETQAAPPIEIAAAPLASDTPSGSDIDPDLVTVKLTAPSWVQIKDVDGKTLVSRIFVTGESWQGPRGQGYSLSLRDAAAADIYLGETKMPALGVMGEAIYDLPLGE